MARSIPLPGVLKPLGHILLALLLIFAPALLHQIAVPLAVAVLGLLRLLGLVLLIRGLRRIGGPWVTDGRGT